jgi:solute:Na+ symporter, SSS family
VVHSVDWIVIGLYMVGMVGIGAWSYRRIHDTQDFFAAGGRMPWWLAGISHHVSGYSAIVFVGYAGIAYSQGFTIYVWWAVSVAVALGFGAFLVAPRWARLRVRFRIGSAMEYLRTRYNLPTQQLLAWSGSLLKIFDVGAKYASIAVILQVMADIPLFWGIVIAGVVSLVYVTVGGLWADALTDMAQFLVQAAAAVVLFGTVLYKLGGASALFGIWEQLPEGRGAPYSGDFTPGFAFAFMAIAFLSYNGGTWNLAQRFIASPMGSDARKAALLSSILFLTFPLILFFPMWAAPILFPDLANPEQVYGILARELLPVGMLGLVVAAMFAATMSMTASDSNAVAAVVTRDILPVLFRRLRGASPRRSLLIARLATLVFTTLTLIVALYAESFGGIIGLAVVWFAGLLGPTAVPMILGLLPAFRHSGPPAAIVSFAAGVLTFAVANFVFQGPFAATTGLPLLVAVVLFIGIGRWKGRRDPSVAPEVSEMFEAIGRDAERSV